MSFAPTLLVGDAEAWYQSLEVVGMAPETWEDFKREIIRRFGDPNLEDNKRGELAALRPGQAAVELRGAMERLLVYLPNLPEQERIWHFRDKLRPSTRFVFEQRPPKGLIEAYELAELVERAATLSQSHSYSAQATSRPGRLPQDRLRAAPWSGGRERGPAPMALHAMQDIRQARAPLSDLERDVLIKNKGCFFCRVHNAGHLSVDCPQRGQRPRPGNGRGRESS